MNIITSLYKKKNTMIKVKITFHHKSRFTVHRGWAEVTFMSYSLYGNGILNILTYYNVLVDVYTNIISTGNHKSYLLMFLHTICMIWYD